MSIAAHFRRVPDALRADAETRVERCAAPFLASGQCDGSRATRPRVSAERAWDKGEATRWIVRDVEARFGKPAWVVFVGDDVTDEDAFAAIERGVGVLVGSRETAAHYQLDSTREVTALLAWLAGEA